MLKKYFAVFLSFIIFSLSFAVVSVGAIGPEELGCGVSRESFTYNGQTFGNWDLSSYFPDTIKNYDIDDKILRPSAGEENGFCKSVNWLLGNGYKYIMIVDLYKCQYSDGTYRTKDYGVIMGFKSPVVSCVKKMAGDGSFYYWLSFGDSIGEYTCYADYGDGSNKYSSFEYSDAVFATSYTDNTISGLAFHKNFAGMKFGSPSDVLPCYDSGYINVMSNFDPKIDGVYTDASSGIQDSLFQGVHTGTFSATSSLNGDISKDLEKFQVSVSNGRSGSCQFLTWISSIPATGTSISNSYQRYAWCYQTMQSGVKVYRQSIAGSLVDSTVTAIDIWGSSFPINIATKMPLYLILKNISDSNLLGLYTDSSLSCPFQLLGSGCSRTISVRISDLPLTTGMPYYLNVVYRDSTSQKLSGIYSSSYGSNLYYDDISQLDGNYTTVLSQSFTITESVYTAPKIDNDGFLVDDNGDVIIDDSGNKIGYSNNYSNDVIGIKNGTTKSDAFATGGSASAQGGSASVINNNTVTVSPTISVTGASGGGTAQSFDDINSETMSNLLASCTNVVGFFKSMVSGLCPEYVWISIGVLVTVVIVLRIMGR